MVDISPAAAREIKRILANKQTSSSSLRLIVKSGGCSGLYYDLKFDSSDTNSDGNSTTANGDRLVKIEGISLTVDSQSWKYAEHLKLDYSEDLMGGGFRFNNPQLVNLCGCGISFAEAK